MTDRIHYQGGSVALTTPFVTVEEHSVLFPSGKKGTYYPVTSGSGHGVVVLCTSMIEGQEHFLLVRQHRYPVDRVMWELPRGGSATHLDAAEAARELVEETGVSVPTDRLNRVGAPLCPDTGLLTTFVSVWHVHVTDEERDAISGHDGEVLEWSWLSAGELIETLSASGAVDAMSLAALTQYRWA